MSNVSIKERLVTETTQLEVGCWRWKKQKNLRYPYTSIDGIYTTVISHYAKHVLGYYPSAVRHTCVNKWCVNPGHLLLTGGMQENVRDTIRDGQRRYSLTNKEAQQVYTLYMTSNETQADIALAFGIDATQVSNIVRGRNWSWSIESSSVLRREKQLRVEALKTEKLLGAIRTGERKTKLTLAQVLNIKKLLKETNLTRKAISQDFGVTPEMISRIALKKAWGWLNVDE